MKNLEYRDRKYLLSSLYFGIGLTGACQRIGWNVMEVSTYLTEHQEFLFQCKAIVLQGVRAVKGINPEYGNTNHFSVWEVNLWESFCTKDEFTSQRLEESLHMLENLNEVSTATGHTVKEFTEYIFSNINIRKYLIRYGYLYQH